MVCALELLLLFTTKTFAELSKKMLVFLIAFARLLVFMWWALPSLIVAAVDTAYPVEKMLTLIKLLLFFCVLFSSSFENNFDFTNFFCSFLSRLIFLSSTIYTVYVILKLFVNSADANGHLPPPPTIKHSIRHIKHNDHSHSKWNRLQFPAESVLPMIWSTLWFHSLYLPLLERHHKLIRFTSVLAGQIFRFEKAFKHFCVLCLCMPLYYVRTHYQNTTSMTHAMCEPVYTVYFNRIYILCHLYSFSQ